MALLPSQRIQQRINKGYGRAGGKLGLPVEIYRPTDPMDPLRLIDLRDVRPMAVDTGPAFKFQGAFNPGNAFRYLLIDGGAVLAGDYLVNSESGDIHFVAQAVPLSPIVAVRCNARVSLFHTRAMGGFGSTEEPGATEEVEVLRGWPASVLVSGRGSGDDVPLPGDTNPAQHTVLMPVAHCADTPVAGDVLVDQGGRRFAVDAAEANAGGWRLLARLLAAV